LEIKDFVVIYSDYFILILIILKPPIATGLAEALQIHGLGDCLVKPILQLLALG
jgi:hypothetical protein